jgi:hypothetical protein
MLHTPVLANCTPTSNCLALFPLIINSLSLDLSVLFYSNHMSLVLGYVALLGMGWNKRVIGIMILCHTVFASPVMWSSLFHSGKASSILSQELSLVSLLLVGHDKRGT